MYHKVILIGKLGSDPEMRDMTDGSAVTNFSVATNRRWSDSRSGESRDETTWFRVSVWGRQAETANQYLSKGRRVLVEGRLQPDPQSGSPRTFTRGDGTIGASYELRAFTVQFLGGREDGGGGSYEEGGDYSGPGAQEEDDIPF
jgi:single-strand DNA-binding protein